jgi:hypothetical protein
MTAVVHSPRFCRYVPRIHTSAVRSSSQRGTRGRMLSAVESQSQDSPPSSRDPAEQLVVALAVARADQRVAVTGSALVEM